MARRWAWWVDHGVVTRLGWADTRAFRTDSEPLAARTPAAPSSPRGGSDRPTHATNDHPWARTTAPSTTASRGNGWPKGCGRKSSASTRAYRGSRGSAGTSRDPRVISRDFRGIRVTLPRRRRGHEAGSAPRSSWANGPRPERAGFIASNSSRSSSILASSSSSITSHLRFVRSSGLTEPRARSGTSHPWPPRSSRPATRKGGRRCSWSCCRRSDPPPLGSPWVGARLDLYGNPGVEKVIEAEVGPTDPLAGPLPCRRREG
jgi:hypothetical protein